MNRRIVNFTDYNIFVNFYKDAIPIHPRLINPSKYRYKIIFADGDTQIHQIFKRGDGVFAGAIIRTYVGELNLAQIKYIINAL